MERKGTKTDRAVRDKVEWNEALSRREKQRTQGVMREMTKWDEGARDKQGCGGGGGRGGQRKGERGNKEE